MIRKICFGMELRRELCDKRIARTVEREISFTNMALQGTSIVGASRGAMEGGEMHAVNPATGEELEPSFYTASKAEIDRAVDLASEAALPYGKMSGLDHGAFLRAIADEIEALGDELTERAMAETALPKARILAETGRTINQMSLFAEVAKPSKKRPASFSPPCG